MLLSIEMFVAPFHIQHSMGRMDTCCSDMQRGGTVTPLMLHMGPISSAVVLFVFERFMKRAVAGQLLRKGVSRKIRRLRTMLTEWHMVHEVLCDLFEDLVY